ncbi:biotin carboxylase N-terminal domain-containing protein [Mycobacterium sp. ENV421]|uniref:acetyl/propionyl/methylcrotonyl-CoA carboxylase subunit alpha n=1 Tax=Mycobacterium sp. ENV421 TaxID=1213407 RepID=UPI0018ED492D|nr:biotin carboxylase N-terminal domain-containing protein [Mycobacterium sp. ENV421]
MTDEPPEPLRTVLIANRGEIAVRVIRAARDAGLRSVAVYGEPDRNALHVREADEALALGGADVASTYLDRDALVSAAHAAGADCVHPGYGFLSEDADFAQAVLDAGLVWIGPPPNTIRRLGDKVAARKIASDVGAPLAEGTTAPVRDAAEVMDFARRHGFPLVIKAAFGGGGRGLKVVRDEGDVPEAFAAATREAAALSGRGDCFVERFLDRARHVEAQVLADTHGTVLVVGLRDCSLQRRNQKLIEEAPAPFLTPDQEQALRSSSQRICRAAGYVSAGTVEYLLGADGTLSFLEVNTRLQVEHAVTEESTGIDLVAEQFRIAGGAALATTAPAARAHSIEFRLTAEDPATGFLPSPGTLTRFQLPTGPGVRVDTGVIEGDTVDGRFDSMFAKLIVTGRDRTQALGRARRALAETRIEGLHTPVSVYRQILDHPAFAREATLEVHNRWIEQHLDQIVGGAEPAGDQLNVRVGRRLMPVRVPGVATLGDTAVAIRRASGQLRHAEDEEIAGDVVTAPMNGTLVRIAVEDGQSVDKGELIAVVEAMKMENQVLAHRPGIVMSTAVSVGTTVAAGAMICKIVNS